MRALIVFGTRPEAIKLAPVIAALRRRGLETIVCVTGQHRDLLDQVLAVFGIVPEYDLDIMEENQSPLSVAARISERLIPVFRSARPDWLLVQGDTTTTFASAWAAFHHRVSIGHVEAGLRTRDKFRPFPEEINRRLTTVVADLHFAPTKSARENLLREGISEKSILLTGNTVVDAIKTILRKPLQFEDPRLGSLSGRILLVTAHRRESFGRPLEDICDAVVTLVELHPDLTAVFPVHPNPAVRSTAEAKLRNRNRILLTAPLAYPEFLNIMKRAELVLSDSGGVQEEAPTVGTPVVILREVTERPEAIESGWAELVGTSSEVIVASARRHLADGSKKVVRAGSNPFGDGQAAERIAEALLARSRETRPMARRELDHSPGQDTSPFEKPLSKPV